LHHFPGAIFHVFQWSAENEVEHRENAATVLLEDLKLLCDEYPKADHFIIGHSHAGNIALRALQNTTASTELSAVVSLSTPFLVASERSSTKRQLRDFRYGVLATVTLIHFIITTFGLKVKYEVSFGMMLALQSVSLPIILAPIYYLISRWERASVNLLKLLPMTLETKVPWLVIQYSGDEASFAIATSSLLCWLADKLWTAVTFPVVAIVDYLDRSLSRHILAGSFLWLMSVLYFFELDGVSMLLLLPALPALLMFAACAATSLSGLFLILLTFLVVPIVYLTLGRSMSGVHIFFRAISVKRQPQGNVSIYLGRFPGVWKFRHSAGYDDPDCLTTLSSWLLSNARKKNRTLELLGTTS
jgi:hypothetical protein